MICDDYDGVWSKIFKKSKNRKAEKVPATAGPCQPPTLGNFGPSAGFTFCSRSPPSVEKMGLRILSKSEGGVTQIQKCETCHVTQGRCGTLGGQTGSPRGQRWWRLAGAGGRVEGPRCENATPISKSIKFNGWKSLVKNPRDLRRLRRGLVKNLQKIKKSKSRKGASHRLSQPAPDLREFRPLRWVHVLFPQPA